MGKRKLEFPLMIWRLIGAHYATEHVVIIFNTFLKYRCIRFESMQIAGQCKMQFTWAFSQMITIDSYCTNHFCSGKLLDLLSYPCTKLCNLSELASW